MPVLWDKESNAIVNNESSDIIRMLNSEFDEITHELSDYYPDALANEIDQRLDKINAAKAREQYADAMKLIVGLRGPVDKFFEDVLVMADDAQVGKDRLALLTMLRDTITQIADISEMVAEEKSA